MDAKSNSRVCYCTLVTSDSFVVGAQALILSILKNSFNHPCDIVVLHTEISKVSLRTLKRIKGVQLRRVEKLLGPKDHKRQVEAWVDYTKIRIWAMTEYERVLYLDADTLVMQNIHDLFERDLGILGFAAAPDVFPPDKFNAGVLCVQPSDATFEQMLKVIPTMPSYDGGDTGFLNSFFPDWFTSSPSNRLPFGDNAQRTLHWLTYPSQPGYWDSIQPKRIIHFSSSPKPWLLPDRKGELELLWWTTYTQLLGSVGKS